MGLVSGLQTGGLTSDLPIPNHCFDSILKRTTIKSLQNIRLKLSAFSAVTEQYGKHRDQNRLHQFPITCCIRVNLVQSNPWINSTVLKKFVRSMFKMYWAPSKP